MLLGHFAVAMAAKRTARVGLGLWNSVPLTVTIELVLFAERHGRRMGDAVDVAARGVGWAADRTPPA